MKKKTIVIGFVLIVVSLFDRLTKVWALHNCQEPYRLTSWIECDLVLNRGVSFGLFHADQSLLYWLVSGLVLMLTISVGLYALVRFRQGFSCYGESMILLGSVSNLVDRVWYNGVVDFLVVSTPWGSWPAYNIADVLIVLGVFYLLITQWFEG